MADIFRQAVNSFHPRGHLLEELSYTPERELSPKLLLAKRGKLG